MIQEILALTIVFAAVVYTVFHSYKFFWGTKKSGCGAGCSNCSVKPAWQTSSKKAGFKPHNLVFNPRDIN